MHKIINQTLQFLFRNLESLSPALSSKLALWLFFRPLRVERPQREKSVYEQARRFQRSIEGFYPRDASQAYYVGYEWGEGPPVLLVHGWAGRGTQFHGLITTLVEAGFKVITFDAPAHGDTPGKRTNLLEFGEILRDLSQIYGEFEGLVAHSFGAVAAVRALVLDAMPAKTLATLGAPSDVDFILQGFCHQLHITSRSLAAITDSLNTLAQNDLNDFSFLAHSPKLTQPLLIFHDTEDRSVAFEQGQILQRACPEAEFVETNGLGHNRILSDPDVARKIVDFLSESRDYSSDASKRSAI